jgi:thiamine-monophosphate kinase
MQVSEIGEFSLIKSLTENIELKNLSSEKGVGDDAAVIFSGEKRILATTDILLEGIHFDLTYTPLKHLGYKAAIVNFSDIYAMNGAPKQLLAAIGLSKRFEVEQIHEIYSGILLACEKYGVDLVGGDISSSLTGLTISLTCLGEAEKDKIVYRNGAKENDLICVTGNLGAAYMGLQLLEREKRVFQSVQNPDFQPDFVAKEYVLERQLKPEARREIIEDLAKNNIMPTAMLDVSDGLSSEILHICTQSGCGCAVYEDKIPIDYQTAVAAEEFNMNITTIALNGGEDYELLFTVPLADYEKIKSIDDICIIGHILPKESGRNLITRDNQQIAFKAQGWKAF